MNVSPGDVFHTEMLAAQAERVRTLYRGEGFLSPEADVTVHEDPEDGQKILDIRVRKGPYFTVSGIDIQGNRSFSDFRIQWLMKTWLHSKLPGSAGRFVDRDLETDVKTLTQFYRKQKYPEVTVDAGTDRDTEKRKIRIKVTVREGPRYVVAFTGNRHFKHRELRKSLVLFDQGNRNDAGMRQSIRAIRKRYREAGFNDARVTFETVTGTADRGSVKQVTVRIDEGVRTVVRQVAVTGNRSVSTAAISKRMLTRPPGFMADGAFHPDVLEEDLNAVRSLYLQKGFPATEIRREVALNRDRNGRFGPRRHQRGCTDPGVGGLPSKVFVP